MTYDRIRTSYGQSTNGIRIRSKSTDADAANSRLIAQLVRVGTAPHAPALENRVGKVHITAKATVNSITVYGKRCEP